MSVIFDYSVIRINRVILNYNHMLRFRRFPFRKKGLFIAIASLFYLHAWSQEQGPNRIWFAEPANSTVKDNPDGWVSDEEWLKALPLGNGSLGIMVFGDVNQERIQLNEMSLWSGSYADSDNPEASKHLSQIRELLFEKKYQEATDLTNKTQITNGKGSGSGNGANVPFGSFQTMGDLWIDFKEKSAYKNYKRELDLIDGIATVEYQQNAVNYKRTIFVSHPDQAIIINFKADKKSKISFEYFLNRPERFKTRIDNQVMIMEGELNDGHGQQGMLYKSAIIPQIKGGKVKENGDKISIEGADEVTLIITAKTNHKLEYPTYLNRNYLSELDAINAGLRKKNFAQLLERHIADFSKFMKRVNFSLGDGINDLPTNELLIKNEKTGNEQVLIPLYFQFGRYLLLSSSREGGLPANLQGIWANKIQTPWNGDYHTDINVQMNYWPAEVSNLSESHKPLLDFIESLVIPGGHTAKTQYGMSGWVVHPITNVWGYTAPGESASWGMHIGASAWLAQHIWEHYLFTEDLEYLKKAYPVLLGAAQFYLDWLVTDPKSGKLVSGPSPSPENTFIAADGTRAQISMGPTHDQQVIDNLFLNIIHASKLLKTEDSEIINEIQAAKQKLLLSKIGPDGRLMEWAEPYAEAEPTHRHLSHLFAFYPASEITLKKTPELAKAVEKSLLARGDDGVGWTYAWKISLWARLKNAEKSLELLNKQLRPTDDTGTKYSAGGGTYYNLFDACPPFQIDGNFGVIAGVAEMLLQSHDGSIDLLPALPSAWKKGQISGLVARGAIEVSMVWDNHKLLEVGLKSKTNKEVKISYQGKERLVRLEAGKLLKINKI